MGIVYDHLPAGAGANYFQDGWGRYLAYDWLSGSWEEAMTSDDSIDGPYIRCKRANGPDIIDRVREAIASAPFPNILFVWDAGPFVIGLISSDKQFPAGGKSKFTVEVPSPVAEGWPELSSARS